VDNLCEICPSTCASWQGTCPEGCPRTEALSIGNVGFFSVALVLVICSCCFCLVNTMRRLYHRRRARQYQELFNQPLIEDDEGDIVEGPWDCSVCDYHNPLPTRTCDMCGASRVPGKSSLEMPAATKSPFSPKSADAKKAALQRTRTVWAWEAMDECRFRWKRRMSRGDVAEKTEEGEDDEEEKKGYEPPSEVAIDVGDALSTEGSHVDRAPTKEAQSSSSSSPSSFSQRGWLWDMRRFNGHAMVWGQVSTPCAFDAWGGLYDENATVASKSNATTANDDDGGEGSEREDFRGQGHRLVPELRDVEIASKLPLGRKIQWFRRQLAKLRVPWDDGHVKVEVRRDSVLSDALGAFDNLCSRGASGAFGFRANGPMPVSRDMHKIFRFEFVGEPAVDAGGVAREFFELAIEALFDPNFALFRQTRTPAMTYWLNANSGFAHPDAEDRHYIRFAGRLLGKALFDGHTTGAYLSRALLKHLLRAPMGVSDLRFVDADAWDMALWLRGASASDLDAVELDFSVTEMRFDRPVVHELKKGGHQVSVNRDNLDEFLHLRAKHTLMSSVAPQLRSFLCGFYDVIPPQLLMVFDAQELELMLCGLPTIDVEDWRANTEYRGSIAPKHKVVRWFWEFVDELSAEMQARLLQFITGTSRVPVSGFRCLVSYDGKMQKFTIQSVKVKLPRDVRRRRRKWNYSNKTGSGVEIPLKDRFCSYLLMPKAHTCFNRLDIPMYISKEELRTHFLLALNNAESVTGFGLD